MTDFKVFFDSNVWLRYFLPEESKIGVLVDSKHGKIFTSVLSIHEVAKRLRKLNYNEAIVRESIRFMHENSIVLGVTEEIALGAVEWSIRHRLHTVDSILYQTARSSGSAFLTFDNDFQGVPQAQVLK